MAEALSLIDYDGPTPDPSWQEELSRIAPRGSSLSWLKLVWVPGDAWEPVHRWTVWEMMDPPNIPEVVRADLAGRNPRVRGRYDGVLKEFIPDPACNVSYQQWKLYQQTGAYGRMLWIVQGNRGGHKRRFTRAESVISRAHGGPESPPVIGELAFAKPDRRTFVKLAQMDKVRLYSALGTYNDRDLDAEDRRIQESMQKEVWEWLESQVDNATGWAGAAGSEFSINQRSA